MSEEIRIMKFILSIMTYDRSGTNYVKKTTIIMYQYLLKQYYTIKRYWEETRL